MIEAKDHYGAALGAELTLLAADIARFVAEGP